MSWTRVSDPEARKQWRKQVQDVADGKLCKECGIYFNPKGLCMCKDAMLNDLMEDKK